MDRKFLALLLVSLVSISLLTLGCADRRNAPIAAPVTPTAIPSAVASPTTQASPAPGTPSATAAPTVTPGSPGGASNGLSLDPSLADISGESDDLTGFPETGLPTPTLD